MPRLFSTLLLCAATLLLATIFWVNAPPSQAADEAPQSDAAVERTRKQVKMLDDLYKTTVVFITETYVKEASDVSAGTAAVTLFEVMKKAGHHDIRLLDATGEPYNEKNVAKDEFEKEAVKRLKAGEKWYEQVVEQDGKRTLRAATPIPVVLQKCVLCHPHYEAAKEKGEIIGLLSYTLDVE